MNTLKKERYFAYRKFFFRMFVLIFILLTPIVLFYSLGYKFDLKSKKFLKTGAIDITSHPKDANVYLNGRKIENTTPCVIRLLMPGKYTLTLDKDLFYVYEMPIDVRSSAVTGIDVTLVPKMRNIEKLKSGMNVQKFFVIERLFGRKIILFTDHGIYVLGENFGDLKKIATLSMDVDDIRTVTGIREDKNKFVFWSDRKIWLVKLGWNQDPDDTVVKQIYDARKDVREVYFGLKEKYLIVLDGSKIIALDVENPSVIFPVMGLKDNQAKMFYDSGSETLIVRDRSVPEDTFSMFKVNFMDLVHEKSES
ncbi:MAG: PEGA domain-containing protein [Candidatus Omnitrophica bacterium]|nr:PEGA domain-containing protein [Candidatus Omnitrophota bacterium]MDD5670684.1 PEGA domain-containing protein [Candidatus Omnitrophota bacterium]